MKKVIVSSHAWPLFGELLKDFRMRRHLTQQQLAEEMGMHRHAIGRWEQGDGLPAKKTVVLELARYLRLDDAEARQLLDASFTALAPPFALPSPRNPLFTGREDLLDLLHQHLSLEQGDALTRSYALSGLGGMGKTHLALEYAYRSGLEYTAVFWISAEQVETILTSFATIADVLQLPGRQEADLQQVVAAVQHWLAAHSQWLLIWDALEDVALLQRYMPSTRQGVILITTRRPTLGTLAQGMELPPLSEEEGILFLFRRARLLAPTASKEQLTQLARRTPGEYLAARELVAMMGGLPLALDQVGAYVEETPCRLAEYLELARTRRTALLKRRGEAVLDHPASVVATWSLAFEQVQQASPASANLLRLCAFLHADAIAEEIFLPTSAWMDESAGPRATDPLAWHEALRAASAYSLLKRNVQEQTLSMHRLVQAILREGMSQQEQQKFQQRAMHLLNAAFPEETHDAWKQCERLLPHVLACAAAIPDHAGNRELADVLRKAAGYLRERARYEEAEALYLRARRLWERVLGSEHSQGASLLYELAILSTLQGKYEQAETMHQRALQIREQALGARHPDVACSLNGLANLAYEQGRYAQAEALYRRALDIWEQVLGSEHPEIARALHNLANLYGMQGRYAEAEPFAQRALGIWEQAWGPDHPNVASALANLAELARAQGKYAQAELLYQRALGLWERQLGPEHPYVAYSLDGLADVAREHQQQQHAEQLYQRALKIREQALGREHPDVACSLHGLANLYREQKQYEQAKLLYDRVLAIQEQHLGRLHPETAKSLADLGRLYEKLGDDEQALSLLQQAGTILEQCPGLAHPETVKAWNDAHRLLERRTRALEALPLSN